MISPRFTNESSSPPQGLKVQSLWVLRSRDPGGVHRDNNDDCVKLYKERGNYSTLTWWNEENNDNNIKNERMIFIHREMPSIPLQ